MESSKFYLKWKGSRVRELFIKDSSDSVVCTLVHWAPYWNLTLVDGHYMKNLKLKQRL